VKGVVNHQDPAYAEGGLDDYKKELDTDPQTQTKASHVFLSELMPQARHPQPVRISAEKRGAAPGYRESR
jgi:hypothetical protein